MSEKELLTTGSFKILNENSQTLGGFWKGVMHEFKWKFISSRIPHFIRTDSRGQNANHTLFLCPLSKINSLLRYQQVECSWLSSVPLAPSSLCQRAKVGLTEISPSSWGSLPNFPGRVFALCRFLVRSCCMVLCPWTKHNLGLEAGLKLSWFILALI